MIPHSFVTDTYFFCFCLHYFFALFPVYHSGAELIRNGLRDRIQDYQKFREAGAEKISGGAHVSMRNGFTKCVTQLTGTASTAVGGYLAITNRHLILEGLGTRLTMEDQRSDSEASCMFVTSGSSVTLRDKAKMEVRRNHASSRGALAFVDPNDPNDDVVKTLRHHVEFIIDDADLVMEDNYGEAGGGILLVGPAQISSSSSANLLFRNNSAKTAGGAILVLTLGMVDLKGRINED